MDESKVYISIGSVYVLLRNKIFIRRIVDAK